MKSKTILFPAITTDPMCHWFEEMIEEQEMYDKEEQHVVQKWTDILTEKNFIGFDLRRDNERLLLTQSCRSLQDWQLSYFDDKGPIMHEDYNKDNISLLIDNLISYSFKKEIVVKVFSN